METKKTSFFKKIKYAIFNFEEYQNFALEKTRTAIKYIVKLALAFSFIIAVLTTYKMLGDIEKAIQNDLPEFEFKENQLIVNNETGEYTVKDNYGYYFLMLDSNKLSSEDIDTQGYRTSIMLLKDKLIIKQQDTRTETLYKNLKLDNINKGSILEYLSVKGKAISIIVLFVTVFVTYLLQILLDILVLSIVGILISRIIGMKFKYKLLFNMSVYAVTLSVILYYIYLIVNTFTGFTISYFRIAYNVINYIYLITAMLMIRNEMIKQQKEVKKIEKVQEEIIEEQKENEEEKKQEDNKENKGKKQKDDKKKGNINEEPEGSKA